MKNTFNEQDIIQYLDAKIQDRAGVRILVYFPDDVSKVAKALQATTALMIPQHPFINYTRSRKDVREADRLGQKDKGAPLNYKDGAWLEKSTMKDIVENRWRHSGYRAAYIHLRLTDELQHHWKSGGPSTAVPGLDLESVKTKSGGVSFDALTSKIAEIQVTTVVMHAWSQIEHDILYKLTPGALPTDTMNRMIDGVNGLSITTEILLDELERNQNQNGEQLKQDESKAFQDGDELMKWLRGTDPKEMDP